MTESFCKQKCGIDPDVLGYQVLILGPEIAEKTEGGIIVPKLTLEEQQRRQNIGIVLKIGPSCFTINPMNGADMSDRRCEVGQWVEYSAFERQPRLVGDHTLYYVSDHYIIARYSEEDAKQILRRFK